MDCKRQKGAGRPKSIEKKNSIIRAATELFLQNGYENTSMDAVAQEAGVSKQTVYGHFQNKENLFCAVIIYKSDEFSPSIELLDQQGLKPTEVLRKLAEGFLNLMCAPECVAMNRLLVSEAGRRNEASKMFFEVGPKRMLTMLEKYFQSQNEKAIMKVPDPAIAADHFFSMVKGVNHLALLLHLKTDISQQQREAYIDSVIDVFTKAYSIRE